MTRWRDPVVAAALTVAAIAGWWTTFAGVTWLLVGAGGAALGAGVVLLHHRKRTLVWAIVTVPVAYLVLGVSVLGVEFDGNGAPRVETLTRVMTGAAECWSLLVGTHPPVDATGVVLLAPGVSGMLTAAIATALALTSSRPSWPIVPLLVLLTGVLVTGSHASTSVGLAGAAYGLACLVWAVVRAGAGAFAGARWTFAAPILVVCALLAVPVGESLLGDQHQRLVLREETAAYGVGVVGTPLDSFRRFRKQPGDLPDNAWRKQLLQATASPGEVPPGTVLRFTVLNRYDGLHWIAANDVEPGSHEDRFQLFSADYLTTDEATDATPIRIGLTGAWSSQWVPLAGRLIGLNVDFPGSVPVSDLRVNPVTSTAVATRTLGGDDEYEFFFEALDTTLPDDAKPSRLVDEPTYDAAEFADNWARAARARASSRMDAVLDAAAQMKRRGRYSDGAFGWEVRFARGHGKDRLDDFLNGPYLVGNDEQYAAAMALVATRLRVPARVVVGARVPSDGIVKGNDVIAWVELRIQDESGGSWRELPRAAYMSFRAPKQDDPPNDPVIVPPEPEPTPEPQPSPSPSPEPDPQDDPADDQEQVTSSRSWTWLIWLLVPAAIGALPAYKLVRRVRRRRAARVSLRYAGAWQELVDTARDLGLAVPTGRSRPAQAAVLGPGSLDLARTADDAVFGPALPTPDSADSYWRAVLTRRSDLGSGLPWWRRWLAPFSLASLRA